MAAPGPEPPERRCCVRTPRAEGSATKGPPGPPPRACSAVGSLMRSSRPLHSRLRPRSAVRRSPLPGPARLLPRLRFPEPGGGGSDQPGRSGHEIKVSGWRSASGKPLLQLSDRADQSDEKPAVGDFEALAVVAVRRGGQLDDLNGPAVRRAVPITHTGMMSQVRALYTIRPRSAHL